MAELLEVLMECAQLIGLGYLASRLRHQKPPELRDLLSAALQARMKDGPLMGGRERLRARLAAKLTEQTERQG